MPSPIELHLAGSEILDPGTELDLPGPGAALLPVEIEIAVGNGVRIEQRVGAARGALRVGDSAVDHDVADMDVLRLQLAREALGEAAQRELAHREGGRARVAFDAGAGAREQDRA